MAAAQEQVFLQLTILLTVAVASHFAIKRFRQPTIVGEIGIGILLGPSVLGFILAGGRPPADPAPGFFLEEVTSVFAALGAIFLLFLVGLEVDVRAIYQRKNVLVALGGVVLPWVFGFLTAFYLVPPASLVVNGAQVDRFVVATFVGAMLVATSTAIAAAVLLELGLVRTGVASTIMGAAVVDDILGFLVLSIAVGVAAGGVDIVSLLRILAVSVAFVSLALYVGTRYFGRLVVSTQAKGQKIGLTHPGFMVAMAVAFLAAFVSEVIGLSAVIGAFLAGAMFSNTPLRKDFHEGAAFLGAIFTPVFFISMGLLVNVWTVSGTLLLFGAVLVAVAFATKLAGCGLTARLTGMSRGESLAVGYGMVPRGEVGLIIALVAERAGVIGPDLFSIVVLVMVVVSVLPAPLLRRALLAVPKGEPAPGLENPPRSAAPPLAP